MGWRLKRAIFWTIIMIYRIIFIILLFFTASCANKHWWKPRGYLLFSMKPKGGSPGYNLGWMHGCESGAGTQFGGGIYKTIYKWKRDPDLTVQNYDVAKIYAKYGTKELKNVDWNDPVDVKKNIADYNLVFWDAHFVCRQTVLGTVQMANMDPVLPGGVRYDPAAHHIGSVWKLDGKGDTRYGSPRTGGLW